MKLGIPVDISLHDSKAFPFELLRFDGPLHIQTIIVLS